MDLITVKEAAELLRVSPATVRNWVREGKLPGLRFSKTVIRIRREEVLRLAERAEVEA